MDDKNQFYPWLKALPADAAVGIATLGILGKMKAPGTWGSAAGVIFYLLVMQFLSLGAYLVLTLLLIYLAIGICGAAEKRLGIKDPGMIILDEFVAIPVCFIPFALLANNMNIGFVIIGFCLFRFFDIKKPFGIKKLQEYEGGLGCVIDDVAAAACTFAVLVGLSALNVITGLSEKAAQ